MVAVVAAIIFVERGHRRITVQYAKRVVGRRQFAGTSTHIPLKVNTGGVIPVIFASSLLAFPATLAPACLPAGGWAEATVRQLAFGMPLYNLLYVALILFFAYFYTAIIFNPDDVAENMRKYGGFIPGIRPGKRTAEHIDTMLTRITLVGAVYLALVAILPEFLISGFKVAPIPFIGETLDANLPNWFTQRAGRAVLLRRHVAADRRRRGDGHGQPGRVAAHHAALRRLREEDAHPRAGAAERGTTNVGDDRAAGSGQGHAGGAVAREQGIPKISTGDMPARGGGGETPMGWRRQGDSERGRAGQRRA